MRQRTFFATLKQYYAFTSEEIRGMILGILITAFIVSFREWGITKFDFFFGLRNFFNSILVVALVFIFFNSGQRIFGIRTGFKVEYKPWIYGLILGLVVAFITNGKIWFLVPGGIVIYHLAGHRLGYFRYGLNYVTLGIVGLMGPLFTLILAIFSKFLLIIFPLNPLIEKLFIVSIAFTVFNMIPVPPLAGSHLFYASRLGYAFCAGGIISACALLFYLSVGWAILGAVLIGIISWAGYYIFFERNY